MVFSHVKVSRFCAKAHLVFYWCLYNKVALDDSVILVKTLTLISSISPMEDQINVLVFIKEK